MTDRTDQKDVKREFDPDFSPENPHNREVARNLRVKYSPRDRAYVDEDGCAIYDQFGQRL